MIPNKFKKTRVVTFKEDYASKPGLEKGEVIFAKGSTHAIHQNTVAKLQAKSVKMDVKEFDHPAYVNRSKKQLAENRKTA